MIKTNRRQTLTVLACALLATAAASPALAGFEWSPPPRAAATPPAPPPVMPTAPAAPVESVKLAPPDVMPAPPPVTEEQVQAAMNEGAPTDPWSGPAAPHTDDDQRQPGTVPVITGKLPLPFMPRPPADAVPPPAVPPAAPVMMAPPVAVPVPAALAIAPRHMGVPVPAPGTAIIAPPGPAPVLAPGEIRAGVNAPHYFTPAVGFGRDIPLAVALGQVVPAGYTYALGDGIDPGLRVSWDGGEPWNQVLQNAVTPHSLGIVIEGNTVWVRRLPARPFVPSPYPAPVTIAPAWGGNAAAPVFGDGWRPVQDWQNETAYSPSYPRRDPLAARERMMQDAAYMVQKEEPSSHDPETAGAIGAGAPIFEDRLGAVPAPVPLAASLPPGVPVHAASPVMAPVPAPPHDLYAAALPVAPLPAVAPAMPVAAVPAMTPPKSYIQLTGLDGGPMARGLEPQQIRYWQAQQGESLRQVLKNWSEQAGVQLFWAEGQDYALPTAVQMHGTYQNAVTRVLQDFGGSFPQPLGQLHPNQPEGPPVLIIDHSA